MFLLLWWWHPSDGLPSDTSSLTSPRSVPCVYALNRALWSDELDVVGRSRINTYMKTRRALSTVSYTWEAQSFEPQPVAPNVPKRVIQACLLCYQRRERHSRNALSGDFCTLSNPVLPCPTTKRKTGGMHVSRINTH